MENDYHKLHFIVNKHDFLKSDSIEELVTSEKLEYLFDIAPVFYLFLKERKESENLQNYAFISVLGKNCFQELKWINSLNSFNEMNLCYFYRVQKQIDELFRITSDIFDLYEMNEINRNSLFDFLNKIPSYNMNVFTQNTIYNALYEIFGLISRIYLSQKISSDDVNELKEYIVSRYYHILVYLKKTELFDKLQIVINSCKTKISIKERYLSAISNTYLLKNHKNQIVDSIKIALYEITDILSVYQEDNKEYLEKLREIVKKFSELKKFSKYTDNQHRCFAIIKKDNAIYFSLSGLLDIENKINPNIEKFKNEINENLFAGQATWCYLSGSTAKYVNEIKGKIVYLPSPIQYKDDLNNAKSYRCCERKILGLYTNMNNFELFVFFSPCFQCAPALFMKKCDIQSFIDYETFSRYYMVTDFAPKKYEIIFIDNRYIVKEIRKTYDHLQNFPTTIKLI